MIEPTADHTQGDWERILANHLTSVFLPCRTVMPQMVRQRRGHARCKLGGV